MLQHDFWGQNITLIDSHKVDHSNDDDRCIFAYLSTFYLLPTYIYLHVCVYICDGCLEFLTYSPIDLSQL